MERAAKGWKTRISAPTMPSEEWGKSEKDWREVEISVWIWVCYKHEPAENILHWLALPRNDSVQHFLQSKKWYLLHEKYGFATWLGSKSQSTPEFLIILFSEKVRVSLLTPVRLEHRHYLEDPNQSSRGRYMNSSLYSLPQQLSLHAEEKSLSVKCLPCKWREWG